MLIVLPLKLNSPLAKNLTIKKLNKLVTNVLHITSAHPRYDRRIFHKQCYSLAKTGYSVALAVADGLGSEVTADVAVLDVGKSNGRVGRVFRSTWRLFLLAKRSDASVIHMHDPELMWVGVILTVLGRTIVFDAHEDLPQQVLTKKYLPRWSRKIVGKFCAMVESCCTRKMGHVVGATLCISQKFERYGVRTVATIKNYPLVVCKGDIVKPDQITVCYVGGLSEERGILAMLDVSAKLEKSVSVKIAGRFHEVGFEERIKSHEQWEQIEYLGELPGAQVDELLRDSHIGMVTLFPTKSYIDSLPVKMFEYMENELFVVASDFPFFKEIVEGSECGVCVDPKSVEQIARAINEVLACPDTLLAMGKNGRKAVIEKYNWDLEEKKLIRFYKSLH